MWRHPFIQPVNSATHEAQQIWGAQISLDHFIYIQNTVRIIILPIELYFFCEVTLCYLTTDVVEIVLDDLSNL